MKELILGGARSGKSHYAQELATNSALPVVYIATATAEDEEMFARIEKHKADRPSDWKIVEEPVSLALILQQEASQNKFIIVDCLTLWLTNLIGLKQNTFMQEKENFLKVLPQLTGNMVFVSNEIGMGVVPMSSMGRKFRDELGWLHQKVASLCDRVTLMTAGISVKIK
jgi:adenosylcobinamide kinase / adenosylcobinamide-phosphate guanylyltransferase